MSDYRHKETGEIKSVSRTRTYINYPEPNRCISLDDGSSLDDWESVDDRTDYRSVLTKKASGDGSGLR